MANLDAHHFVAHSVRTASALRAPLRALAAWREASYVCVMIAALLAAPAARALDGAAGAVAVVPSEVDEDFALQGEFAGASSAATGRRRVGLQVIARGGGRFEAVRWEGGLPGAGADTGRSARLGGERDGDRLWLRGEAEVVCVEAEQAWTYTRGGEPIGYLRRVQRAGPTLGLAPPPQAQVLFGGDGQSAFADTRLTADGNLLSGVVTPMPVGDFYLHLEFRTPYMPHASGQGRGNSGVYIQRRYEVQILDSFGLEGAANECGGLYKQQPPDINMCLPPLAWQTYDIHFTAARWDEAGQKIAPARVTVFHNGVAVHYRRAIETKTGAGQPEGPAPLPIQFQDHGDPVSFRNVWIVLNPSELESPVPHGEYSPMPAASCRVRWTRARR